LKGGFLPQWDAEILARRSRNQIHKEFDPQMTQMAQMKNLVTAKSARITKNKPIPEQHSPTPETHELKGGFFAAMERRDRKD
jgi:hypothetical protein